MSNVFSTVVLIRETEDMNKQMSFSIPNIGRPTSWIFTQCSQGVQLRTIENKLIHIPVGWRQTAMKPEVLPKRSLKGLTA